MQQQQQHPSTSTAASPATSKPGGDDHFIPDVTLESVVPIHATGDVELLSYVRAPAPDEQYETIGGVVYRVAAVGRLLATPDFDVPDVRHVPGLGGQRTVVVVSVLELARRGLAVGFGFGPRTCNVKDPYTGDIVGEGRRRGGRYYLDYLRVPPST